MKYKIEELKDITDSREIMQSKPEGFSKYMMYIIIVILALVLIWSIIATKEISIKANGVVKPSEEITKISASLNGKVTSNNLYEGMKVKQGDVLLVIDGEEYVLQKKSLEESLEKSSRELEANKSLKNSILDGVNYLDKDDKVQSNYYKMYELFVENIKNGNTQNDALNTQKESIKETIVNLNLLLKSYKEEVNYIKEGNHLYYQYVDYELTLKNYRNQILDYEEQIKTLEDSKVTFEENQEDADLSDNNQGEIQDEQVNNDDKVNEEIDKQIEAIKSNINTINSEIEKYKNTAIMNITNNIAQNEASLKEGVSTSNNGSYKEQYITQLDSTISSLEASITEIEMNLDITNNKINETSIKAQYDGVISLINDIKVGDFIQAGTQIASIIPSSSGVYKADVYIENQDFAEINEGENVVLEFAALPQSEYGIIETKIEEISIDAKVSEEQGTSYYTGTCKIPVKEMKNKSGTSIQIKNGMLVQARIVNREISYFRYFLEKINILDE